MADVQVTCIIKPHPQSPHEHITHPGNPPSWVWTRKQIIASIEAEKLLICGRTRTGTGTATCCR